MLDPECLCNDVGSELASDHRSTDHVIVTNWSEFNIQDSASSTVHWDFDSVRIECLAQSYSQVIPTEGICTIPIYVRNPSHTIGGLYSQMNVESWLHELSFENDLNLKDYLQFGIVNGFYIVNPDDEIGSYCCDNYTSVLKGPAFDFIDKLIIKELAEDKFLRVSDRPHCVHSLGAIPKGDGSFRPITDCKRPLGSSINNYMSDIVTTFSYKSIDTVVSMLNQGDYMATVDIASAYRSVSVHPDHWKYQGISWTLEGNPVYLLDSRVCFGLKNAPFLFSHISNFVVRCMQRRGFHRIVNYLDDFVVIGDTFESCQQAQNELIHLLISLGFYISWKKCTSPSSFTRYLGIDFDTDLMTISLPAGKLDKLHHELTFFESRRRATKRQLQRLCGILSQCARVIKGSRTFSRRIIDMLKNLAEGNPRVNLSQGFREDLLWWRQFAKVFNGTSFCIAYNYGQGPEMYSDSSKTGYGLTCQGDWQAGFFNSSGSPNWSEDLNDDHGHWLNVPADTDNINVLELIPIWLGLLRFGPSLENTHLVCRTDNTQVMHCINKGVSSNRDAMSLLRKIFWLCIQYNIHVTARHIPGVENITADWLSRLRLDASRSTLQCYNLCCSRP